MTAILFPLLLTILVSAPPQQPRDGARPATTGTSRLSGVVVTDGRSPQPVRRAVVTITASALGVSRSTITDDEGRFAFDALPAGRFTVTAARRAYLTSAFGAAHPGDAGTPVSVGDAAHADEVRITLWKGAVLTGVITDHSGTPIPSLQVTVFRVTESRYESAGGDVTDDRGVYRVYGLRPGDYLVSAAPRPTGAGDMGVRSEREIDALLSALERRGSRSITAARPGEIGADSVTADQRTYSFGQVYYPGTAMAAEAPKITVAPGEERTGLDFSVIPVPTARVTGLVTGSDGQPARDVQISIVPVGPPVTIFAVAGAPGSARTGADGSFHRSSVTPGIYRILARQAPSVPPRPGMLSAPNPVAGRGSTTEWAMTEITVNGDDIDGVALALQPGLRVTGRIVFEGTSEIPRNLSVARVTLTPVTALGRTANVITVPAKADGAIEITNLLPGSYQVGMTLPEEVAERWWLRSAMSSGRDLLDAPMELAAVGAPEVVFTLSDRRPALSGVVHDADERLTADAVLVVFSDDRAHWRRESRRVRTVRPATDGRYEVTDIPPGEYLVAAVRRMQPDAWRQPAFLERLAAGAVRVVLGEAEQKTQNVRVSGARRP